MGTDHSRPGRWGGEGWSAPYLTTRGLLWPISDGFYMVPMRRVLLLSVAYLIWQHGRSRFPHSLTCMQGQCHSKTASSFSLVTRYEGGIFFSVLTAHLFCICSNVKAGYFFNIQKRFYNKTITMRFFFSAITELRGTCLWLEHHTWDISIVHCSSWCTYQWEMTAKSREYRYDHMGVYHLITDRNVPCAASLTSRGQTV